MPNTDKCKHEMVNNKWKYAMVHAYLKLFKVLMIGNVCVRLVSQRLFFSHACNLLGSITGLHDIKAYQNNFMKWSANKFSENQDTSCEVKSLEMLVIAAAMIAAAAVCRMLHHGACT